MSENKLLLQKHILLCGNDFTNDITKNFCGRVFTIDEFDITQVLSDTLVYIYGDIEKISMKFDFVNKSNVNIILELSTSYEDTKFNIVNLGEVPLNINNVGVYFRSFFDPNKNYYEDITGSHYLQTLRMSNTADDAYRRGIYLTKIENINNELHFRLLRCSTNLDGPTDNFRDIDNYIVDKVNKIGLQFFREKVELNHVLAQTYHNVKIFNKEKKATISKHSDKTKDMPKNALMAFCSFYKNYKKNTFNDVTLSHIKNVNTYDYQHKKQSVLTKLRFELKSDVLDNSYVKSFDILLYPNSVFLMSLETNRLYTHAIIAPNLSIGDIPTRLGYVIRTSNTDAIYKNDQTHIKLNDSFVPLIESTRDGTNELRQLYFRENTSIDMIDYENKFNFSMNNGDYLRPLI